jgi:6-phosphogluconolactonase
MSGINVVKSDGLVQSIPTINELIRASVNSESATLLAASGGQTPIPLYQNWLKKGMPFRGFANIVLTDERFTSHESSESNLKNCWSGWKSYGPTHRLIPINTEGTIEQCARQYEAQILSFYSGSANFLDIAILGIGEDGHTASIFPNRNVTVCPFKLVGWTYHPVTGQARITLTESFLNTAKTTMVLCFGESKQAALKLALSKDCNLPIARIMRKPTTFLFSDLL